MILGMSTSTFTLVHVLISLAGIGSGFVVLFGLLSGKLLANWNSIFLLPSHKLGIISLVVLAMAVAALYGFKLAGKWRTTYVVTAVLALYLNCFVAVVQSFLKIPALHAMAHTQTESPFLVAQTIVLLVLVGLGIVAAKRFRPASPAFTVHSRAA